MTEKGCELEAFLNMAMTEIGVIIFKMFQELDLYCFQLSSLLTRKNFLDTQYAINIGHKFWKQKKRKTKWFFVSQHPVHGYDQADVSNRQADSREHEQHGDQTGAGHTGRPNARQRRRETCYQKVLCVGWNFILVNIILDWFKI